MMRSRAVAGSILLAGLWLVGSGTVVAQAPWPTARWAVATPEARGLRAAPLDSLHRAIQRGTYGNVDRLVVVKDGFLVVNHRYPRDYREVSRGRRGPIGCGPGACAGPHEVHQFNYFHPDFHPYFQGREVHTLQSVTKSVTATLIGIAIGQGRMAGTHVNLLAFLRDYDLTGVDPRLRRATLADLLTMRSGIEWHEADRPLDSTNTTLQLEASRDWVQFTLEQPMDADPGSKWAYSSGGSQLMSAVLRSATSRTADVFAETYLFGPLGIRDYHWKLTPTGLPDTEGGLYLEAEALAKIGYLYLNDGVWDGRRILPEGWVAASTAAQVADVNQAGWDYGYQWWRLDRGDVPVWAGLGFGGQFLLILPAQGIVGVVNSWNVFGDQVAPVLTAAIDALIASAGGG